MRKFHKVRILLSAVCASIAFIVSIGVMLPVRSQDDTGRNEFQKKMQNYLSERWTPKRISEFCRLENQYIGASVLPQDNKPTKYVSKASDPESVIWAREAEASDRCFWNAAEKSLQNRFRQHLVPNEDAVGGTLHPTARDIGEVTWFANFGDSQKDCAYCVRVRDGSRRWILEIAPIDFVNWSDDDFLVHNIETSLLNTMNAYVYSRDKAAYCWKDRVACLVQRSHAELVRQHGAVSAYQCDLPNGQRLKAALSNSLRVESVSIGGPIDEFWTDDVLKHFNANLNAALNPWSKKFVEEELGKCKRIELWQFQEEAQPSGRDRSEKYFMINPQAHDSHMTKILSSQPRFTEMKKLIRAIWDDIFDEKCLAKSPEVTQSRNVLILFSSSEGPKSRSWSIIEELRHTGPCTRDANVLQILSLSPAKLGLRDAEFDNLMLQLKSISDSLQPH